MVSRTFNFWGFCGQYWKTPDFNDRFSKKSLKPMVLSTFNFWGFCGQYRDFHYYWPLNQSLDQSTNQPINQSINQSITQSIK